MSLSSLRLSAEALSGSGLSVLTEAVSSTAEQVSPAAVIGLAPRLLASADPCSTSCLGGILGAGREEAEVGSVVSGSPCLV